MTKKQKSSHKSCSSTAENRQSGERKTDSNAKFKGYFISCSKPLKTSDAKKSSTLMDSPSQIFLTVATVVLLFRPLTMLLSVDWVMPLIVASLLTVILFSSQSSSIRNLTASPTFMPSPRFRYLFIIILSLLFVKYYPI